MSLNLPIIGCGICPEGTTYNPETNSCVGLEYTNPICSPNTIEVGEGDNNANYGKFGGRFFEEITNFVKPLIESGTGAVVSDNGNGVTVQTDGSNVSNSLWNQRLNQVGVWGPPAALNFNRAPVNEWIGFTVCVELEEDALYSIGLAGDNYVRFSIDNEIIYEATTGSTRTFNNWWVFPIQLSAGKHIITLEGFNVGSAAAFGAEVYNTGPDVLRYVSNETTLEPYIEFSTKNMLGQQFDIGENSGCSCPNGYTLERCDGELVCSRTVTAPFEECPCYTAISCKDQRVVVNSVRFADPNFVPVSGVIYQTEEYPDECLTFVDGKCDEENINTLTITRALEECECAKTCYQINLCECLEGFGNTPICAITVEADLSEYLGKVARFEVLIDQDIDTLIEVCGEIVLGNCDNITDFNPLFTVTGCFDTCEECLPEPIPEPDLSLKYRPVQPGWNSDHCPTDYIEKVECKFSEFYYQDMASKRFGIKFCCGYDQKEDKRRYTIKHNMLLMSAISDPDACKDNCCLPVKCAEAEIELNCLPVSIALAKISCPPGDNLTYNLWSYVGPQLTGDVDTVVECIDVSEGGDIPIEICIGFLLRYVNSCGQEITIPANYVGDLCIEPNSFISLDLEYISYPPEIEDQIPDTPTQILEIDPYNIPEEIPADSLSLTGQGNCAT